MTHKLVSDYSAKVDERVTLEREIIEHEQTILGIAARCRDLEGGEDKAELFRARDKERHTRARLAAARSDLAVIVGELDKMAFESEFVGDWA